MLRLPPRTARAFTLLELLIVIALIALLIGILLPVLSYGREAARRTLCLSNLRQMVVASHHYTTDYRDHFPPALYGNWMDDSTPMCGWDFITLSGDIQPGLLWTGGGALQIQQCPSMTGSANASGDPYTGYNYNTSYLGGPTVFSSIVPPRTAKQEEVRTPSSCAAFGDGELVDGGANKYMRSPFQGPRDTDFYGSGDAGSAAQSFQAGGTQGFRHLKTTSAAFVDGHATSFDLPHHQTYSNSYYTELSSHVGFLSPDNQLYDFD